MPAEEMERGETTRRKRTGRFLRTTCFTATTLPPPSSSLFGGIEDAVADWRRPAGWAAAGGRTRSWSVVWVKKQIRRCCTCRELRRRLMGEVEGAPLPVLQQRQARGSSASDMHRRCGELEGALPRDLAGDFLASVSGSDDLK